MKTKERKPADYGMKPKMNKFKTVIKPKYSGQCKRAGTADANDTKHK